MWMGERRRRRQRRGGRGFQAEWLAGEPRSGQMWAPAGCQVGRLEREQLRAGPRRPPGAQRVYGPSVLMSSLWPLCVPLRGHLSSSRGWAAWVAKGISKLIVHDGEAHQDRPSSCGRKEPHGPF